MGLVGKVELRATIFSGSPEAPEASVLANAIQGMLCSASSPDGKLYRFDGSQLTIFKLSDGSTDSYPAVSSIEIVNLVSATKIS